MLRRITIRLDDTTLDAAARVARTERRDTREQIALMVEHAVGTMPQRPTDNQVLNSPAMTLA